MYNAGLTIGMIFLGFPNIEVAEAHKLSGGKTFTYRFDKKSPNKDFRAAHAQELPYVFG